MYCINNLCTIPKLSPSSLSFLWRLMLTSIPNCSISSPPFPLLYHISSWVFRGYLKREEVVYRHRKTNNQFEQRHSHLIMFEFGVVLFELRQRLPRGAVTRLTGKPSWGSTDKLDRREAHLVELPDRFLNWNGKAVEIVRRSVPLHVDDRKPPQ